MSNRDITLDELAQVIKEQASEGRRLIIAIVGAPGSGKSHCTALLLDTLRSQPELKAAILPMDGYHLDDAILNARGLRARKGASDTFDVGGLLHMLQRLRTNGEKQIFVPLFDRGLEIARSAAAVIEQDNNIILVEGNYLLLNERPWTDLHSFFDMTILIDAKEETLRARLVERWQKHSIPEQEIHSRVEQNDLPNGRFVKRQSLQADYLVKN